MPGLVPGIQRAVDPCTWIAGTSPAMTALVKGKPFIISWKLRVGRKRADFSAFSPRAIWPLGSFGRGRLKRAHSKEFRHMTHTLETTTQKENPRPIDKIVVHCSATPATRDIGSDEIRTWHLSRGWNDIGYHYVIRRDGTVEPGRPEVKVGAHARGLNHTSIAICLIGGQSVKGVPQYNFTQAQMRMLIGCVKDLQARYPRAKVHGHNEFSEKACPTFDVRVWARDLCI